MSKARRTGSGWLRSEGDEPPFGDLGAVVRPYVESGRIAGATTLVVLNGETVHLGSFGYADLERRVTMRPDTIMRVYSLTKPVTVVAALILRERGLLGLDDPLAMYIPSFGQMTVTDSGGPPVPAKRPITVRHLMTHTSGIGNEIVSTSKGRPYFELMRDMDNSQRSATTDVTTEQFVDAISELPLIFHPGERWHYGLSFEVLGRLVEVVSGRRLGAFLHSEIFEPLGMTDTGFTIPPYSAERLAALYSPLDTNRTDLENNLRRIDDPPESLWLEQRAYQSGGAGLVSTVIDYGRFAQMLIGGGSVDGTRILSPETVSLMTSDHLNDHQKVSFNWVQYRGYTCGLGIRVMVKPELAGCGQSVGEFGWAGRAGTWVWIDPNENLVALFMPQLTPDLYYPTAAEFISSVYSAIRRTKLSSSH